MDPDDSKLFEIFQEKKGLRPDAPALQRTAAELEEGLRRTQAILGEGPSLRLSAEDRADLAGDRFPQLQGIVEMLASALARHPELARKVHAGPEQLQRAVQLDRAIARAVFAAQLLWRGGECGRLLAAAAAARLCRDLLGEAAAREDRGAAPPVASALRAAFAEPRRLAEEMRTRKGTDPDATGAREGTPPAPVAAPAPPADPAAVARVLGAFLSDLGRRP